MTKAEFRNAVEAATKIVVVVHAYEGAFIQIAIPKTRAFLIAQSADDGEEIEATLFETGKLIVGN